MISFLFALRHGVFDANNNKRRRIFKHITNTHNPLICSSMRSNNPTKNNIPPKKKDGKRSKSIWKDVKNLCFTMNENRSHNTYRSFTQRWLCCVPFFFVCCCCFRFLLFLLYYTFLFTHSSAISFATTLSISKCECVGASFFPFSQWNPLILPVVLMILCSRKKNWCSCNCSYYIFTNFKCTRPFFAHHII